MIENSVDIKVWPALRIAVINQIYAEARRAVSEDVWHSANVPGGVTFSNFDALQYCIEDVVYKLNIDYENPN